MLRKCIIVLVLGLLLAAPASARKYGDDTMFISPRMFVVDYQGSRLTVHTEIPFGDVDRDTLELFGVDGASIVPVFVKPDLRGNLVAKFAADDIRTIVAVPRTELTLTGLFKDGESFSLHATIRVK